MGICRNCGNQYKEGLQFFCDKCGSKIVQENIVSPPKESSSTFCGNCGYQLKVDSSFCPKCGRGIKCVESVEQQPQITPIQNQSTIQPTQELYRKKNLGYNTGSIINPQISGALVITTTQITFKAVSFPLTAIQWSKYTLVIDMGNIMRAERTAVLGINTCIRIYTKDGKKYTFNFGLSNTNDIDSVVQLINRYKC